MAVDDRGWNMVVGGGAGMAEFDDLKGRAKEAAGDLTGDEDLKREGKTDQTAGKVKDLVGRASDKIKGVLRRD